VTLSIAWVRSVGGTEELIVATDSRLRFGCAWDCCPKIIELPRSDCLLCFAGGTAYAYPLMLQAENSLGLHPKSRTRAFDLNETRAYVLEVFNAMTELIGDPPQGADLEPPDAAFLLGGFDWRSQEFLLWVLYYDEARGQFDFHRAQFWEGIEGRRKILFLGDETDQAKLRLLEILADRGKLDKGGFDFEPFEVLRDMIREEVSPYIGGPPQMAKVYKHLNVLRMGVYWPTREANTIAVNGRPLLGYEKPHVPIIDPDSLEVTHL
jgi:hypothetical protein